MAEETEILFNYKGKDILIKKRDKGYVIGVQGKPDIWFDSLMYDSLKLARTSGREYARIVIDKMLISKQKKITNI
jgi:hypothetical protein